MYEWHSQQTSLFCDWKQLFRGRSRIYLANTGDISSGTRGVKPQQLTKKHSNLLNISKRMRFQDGRFAFSELRPEILRMARGTFRVYQANTNTDGTLCLRYEVATINGCHIPY